VLRLWRDEHRRHRIRDIFIPGEGGHPRAWVLEVSRDGNGWEEIDRRLGSDELNGAGKVATFGVSKRRRARSVRLRQIDRNHRGLRYFSIGSLEVLGSLLP
jgi:hypothetical protein